MNCQTAQKFPVQLVERFQVTGEVKRKGLKVSPTYPLVALIVLSAFWAQYQVFRNNLFSAESLIDRRFNRLEENLSLSLFPSKLSVYFSKEDELTYYKILSMKRYINKSLAREIAYSAVKYARVYHKDVDLILAIIATESNFNPKAVSPTGALGLMQVMPFWKKDLDIPCDLKSVDCGIQYGVRILDIYDSQYEDVEYTLAAYNRGPLAVLRDVEAGNSVSDYYTKRVLSFRNKLILE